MAQMTQLQSMITKIFALVEQMMKVALVSSGIAMTTLVGVGYAQDMREVWQDNPSAEEYVAADRQSARSAVDAPGAPIAPGSIDAGVARGSGTITDTAVIK